MLPREADSFLSKLTPFQKGDKINFDRIESPESVSVPL